MQPAPFLQPVITRCRLLALRTFSAHALMRLEPNIDRLRLPLVSAQFNFLINKPSKVLNRVQKSLKLELNSWSPFVDRLSWQIQTKSNPGRSATRLSSCLFFSDFPAPPEPLCARVKASSWGRAHKEDPRPMRRTGSEEIGSSKALGRGKDSWRTEAFAFSAFLW